MVTIDTLRVVFHPVRRRILDYLGERRTARVGDIARDLDLQVGSVSHHLRMLERESLVEQVADPSGDGRTSWWRPLERSISWSVDDFTDGSEAALARDMERANVQYQVDRLADWKRRAAGASREWRDAAFSIDNVSRATPAEVTALSEAMARTFAEWAAGIDESDGQERKAVRVFTHGFPTVS